MKVAILCGGLGTRLREETIVRPKPMVEIGDRPILFHIMKMYAAYGHKEFVLCLGYKGDVIRDYFLSYELMRCDVTVRLGSRDVEIHDGSHPEADWAVTMADTGDKTLTGSRLRRVSRYLEGGTFMATYGDGVADIDVDALLAFHASHGRLATVTAVRPSSRFGELAIEDGVVRVFREKPQVHEGWVNGGFFVFDPRVLAMAEGDESSLEADVLVRLAEMGELGVYQHSGFWQCMDTYREMEVLNELWRTGRAPWMTRAGR